MSKCLYIVLLAALGLAAAIAQKVIIPEVPDQLEALSRGELELKDPVKMDKNFDDTILSEEGRPTSKPDQRETEAVYRKQKQESRIEGEPAGRTALVDVNLYVKYYVYKDWYSIYYKCCPRRQNYGCRSYRRPLPCHSHIINGRREWCCAFYPRYPSLYIANCNCKECAIFGSSCVVKGTCQRRYSYRTYYAVCYRNNSWGYVRRMRRLLPTSCYCRPS
ncbi:hypothetical protein ElyMa_002491500 [Elysia marginata]|uniref:Uncharacterized protein n=1 Tax=Elysia marginata TaxID=1093978 RepID=A0AAV4GNM7_9GAST|nr:hypothetical protein ElyMa_002491500 [Elysia marginata]